MCRNSGCMNMRLSGSATDYQKDDDKSRAQTYIGRLACRCNMNSWSLAKAMLVAQTTPRVVALVVLC